MTDAGSMEARLIEVLMDQLVALRASIPRRKKKMLLITDVGRDIDDTVTIFAISAMPSVDLVGLVTSGGGTVRRAELARGWLRHLGVSDSDCAVAAGPEFKEPPFASSRSYGDVQEIENLCSLNESDHALHSSSKELILSLAEDHGKDLVIVGIGPLSPLSEALAADEKGCLKEIGGVYVQGIMEVVDKRLCPVGSKSYNFREHIEAAQMVFEELQDFVPFVSLGSQAAYKVGLTTRDFGEWEEGCKEQGLPCLGQAVKLQMNTFRESAPDIFYQIYPVPLECRTREKWFQNLPQDIVSRPYDPLVVLFIDQPELFDAETFATDSAGIVHRSVGNSKEHAGVIDGDTCRFAISRLVKAASAKMLKVSFGDGK